MCLYPKLIRNTKYIKNKKNGGIIPAIRDNRVLAVPVGCGKCMECMKKEQRKWQVRLGEENLTTAHFVTLTFSNEEYKKLYELTEKNEKDEKGYEKDNKIATIATRRFLERWRKKYKKSIRHWLVTELGHNGTENIHIHGLIWTDKKEEIEKIWGYGYTHIGEYVNAKTINYITKYISKRDNDHKYYKPKILTSAGIGAKYIETRNAQQNKYKEGETNEAYKNKQGYKMGLPIYYRNKIYTDEEREKLWIEKLDEETRYVDGQKIDISKGEEEYNKIREIARKKNERLGYQNDEIDWKEKEYERTRRIMLQKARIEPKENASGGSGIPDGMRALEPNKNW